MDIAHFKQTFSVCKYFSSQLTFTTCQDEQLVHSNIHTLGSTDQLHFPINCLPEEYRSTVYNKWRFKYIFYTNTINVDPEIYIVEKPEPRVFVGQLGS